MLSYPSPLPTCFSSHNILTDVTAGRAHLSFTRSPSKTLPRTTTAVTTVTRTTRRQCSGERLKSEPPPPPPSRGAGAPPLEPKPKPSLFMAYLGRYTALLETRPLATKAITSGVIGEDYDCFVEIVVVNGNFGHARIQHNNATPRFGGECCM